MACGPIRPSFAVHGFAGLQASGRAGRSALLWLCAALFAIAAHAAAPGGLDDLRAALARLDQGDVEQARLILDRTRDVVGAVRADLARLRSRTRSCVTVCDRSLERLERVRGEVIGAQEQLQRELRVANERLSNARSSEQSAQAQLKSLRVDMANVQSAMRQHAERLRELERWWWVPGYGAYLGIRELVDHDAQRVASLQRDLHATGAAARQEAQRAEAARVMARQLNGSISRGSAQAALLDKLQRELLSRIAALRSLDDFLRDAAGVLEEVDSLIDIQISGATGRVASDLRRLLKRADDHTTAAQALRAKNVVSLSQALELLADKAEQEALIARLQSEDCEVRDEPEDWRRALHGPGAGPRPPAPAPDNPLHHLR
jgi:hypothetical protein